MSDPTAWAIRAVKNEAIRESMIGLRDQITSYGSLPADNDYMAGFLIGYDTACETIIDTINDIINNLPES